MLWFYNSLDLMYELPKKDFVFLAGPTDRFKFTKWRQDFLDIVPDREKYHFFIPEYCDEYVANRYSDCIASKLKLRLEREEIYKVERSLLKKAYKIIFWIDRRINDGFPALTTNIEFGNFHSPMKCICGSPLDAERISYMKYVWEEECNQKWYFNMEELISHMMKYLRQIKD